MNPTSDSQWFSGRRPTHRPANGGPLSILAELDAPEWMSHGLCAQTDPESFFPEKGGSVREAKKTCLSCDVRTECLAYALEHGERFGVWGGLTERERRKLAKNDGPRPCAREGCDELIPATAHGRQRYHTPECGQLARTTTEGVA